MSPASTPRFASDLFVIPPPTSPSLFSGLKIEHRVLLNSVCLKEVCRELKLMVALIESAAGNLLLNHRPLVLDVPAASCLKEQRFTTCNQFSLFEFSLFFFFSPVAHVNTLNYVSNPEVSVDFFSFLSRFSMALLQAGNATLA